MENRKEILRNMRSSIYENVLYLLAKHDAKNPIKFPYDITLEVEGMDEKYCPTINYIYRADDDIWVGNSDDNFLECFDYLTLEQMCDVEYEVDLQVNKLK